MIKFRRTTNTSSSRFTSISTSASSLPASDDMAQVHTLRVSRGKSGDVADRYYRAMVSASSVPWDMLTQYTECELVGKGSYGDVCRAHRVGDHQPAVAVKRVDILEDDLDSDWENGLRLLREIHFLRTLDHPNLSKLVDLFPNKDYHDDPRTDQLKTIYVVTEYCSSGSLNGYSPSSFLEILSINHQVLSALDYLHTHNILHRDIKRENIFIRRTSQRKVHAVVGDFGLSRSRTDSRMTSEVVTKPYRCPSLILGETHYGGEIDVYATGIVFAEMLFGKLNSTLLPNRKMGPKNFLKYQYALWLGGERSRSASHSSFSRRLCELAAQMHVDLNNVVESPYSTDYDDQVVQEWSKLFWEKIRSVDGMNDSIIAMLRSMIGMNPTDRPTVTELLRFFSKQPEHYPSYTVRDCAENFDERISILGSDSERALAVKDRIASIIGEYQEVSPINRRYSLRLSRKRSIRQT